MRPFRVYEYFKNHKSKKKSNNKKNNKKKRNREANRNRFHGKYLSNSILGASGVCAQE